MFTEEDLIVVESNKNTAFNDINALKRSNSREFCVLLVEQIDRIGVEQQKLS